MKPLSDIAAERGVLSGICQYGQNSFLDVADVLKSTTFTVDYNQIIYSCLEHMFKESEGAAVDVASVYSAGEEMGLGNIMSRQEFLEHLNSMFNFPILKENVRKFAAKIRKLEIARLLRDQLKETADSLLELTGNESVTNILGLAENSIFDFSSKLHDGDNEPKKISDGLVDYVQYLSENIVDQIGISTGFPEFDKAIGGGLRNGTVSMVGARPKTGKSCLGANIGFYIAKTHKIPVLCMDTEMTYSDHLNRLLAMASDCFIYDVETGKFSQKPNVDPKLRRIAREIEEQKINYSHKQIADMPFEEQLSVMRRWIVKTVGLNSEGKANPCVIIYDYLKLMSSSGINANTAEFQALGFMISALHNFTVKYDFPMLGLMQLNRDGINKEGTDVASGSDRIVWLCSNFTIFKEKSDEEVAQDGLENGNRKLVPVVQRHGPGMSPGDYINCHMKGATSKIVEGKTKFQLMGKDDE
jgi:replicative DNA helicase